MWIFHKNGKCWNIVTHCFRFGDEIGTTKHFEKITKKVWQIEGFPADQRCDDQQQMAHCVWARRSSKLGNSSKYCMQTAWIWWGICEKNFLFFIDLYIKATNNFFSFFIFLFPFKNKKKTNLGWFVSVWTSAWCNLASCLCMNIYKFPNCINDPVLIPTLIIFLYYTRKTNLQDHITNTNHMKIKISTPWA